VFPLGDEVSVRNSPGSFGVYLVTTATGDVTATARDDDGPSHLTQSAVACLPLTPLISQVLMPLL
jgi:hypothetical protein